METSEKEFPFNDDSKSLGQVEALRPAQLNHLEDMGSNLEELHAEATIQVKYYQEFKKIYLTSYKLSAELRKQGKNKEGLVHRIAAIESQLTALHKARRHQEEAEVLDEGDTDRRGNKRTRRTAEEIERKFNCMAQFCGRCYGSQGSLQQHIKLKHPDIYKREHSGQED